MKGALLVLLVALALWWVAEPCWEYTDAALEACTGVAWDAPEPAPSGGR